MRQLLIPLSLALSVISGCIYLPAPPSTPGSDSGQPPIISTFEANPDALTAGSRAALNWTVTGARSVSINNGVGTVALRGTRTVIPTTTTTYTLTAANPSGTVTANAQILVTGSGPAPVSMPVINSFDAVPIAISAGGAAVLSWNISNASSATIGQGIGSVNAAAGTQTVTPAGTTTYILTAVNDAGSVIAAAIVSVSAAPPDAGLPVINLFEANPAVFPLGSSTTLNWNVSNASQVTILSGGGSFLMADPVGSVAANPAASTTYMLTATNASGTVSKNISVAVGGGGGPDVTPPHVPVLSSPAEGATLPQPNAPWSFDWVDSADVESGIAQYQVYVIRAGAGSPAIDAYTANSHYSKTVGGSLAADLLNNWTWKVRAQNNTGLWSDWSAIRTFNVQPVPAVSHIVNLSPVAAETGAVYKDGTVSPGFKSAGDTSGNVAIRCYFSYDLSGLAGKEVTNARLNLAVNSLVRDPFGHLGGLWVAKVNYGLGALQAADYNLIGVALAPAFGAVPGEIEVTSIVKGAVLGGTPRFQTRVSFASETNGDNLADYVNFSNAVMTITYND